MLKRVQKENDTKPKITGTPTLCIIHKGFRGFQALSQRPIAGWNSIGLNPSIPYEIIRSPLIVS